VPLIEINLKYLRQKLKWISLWILLSTTPCLAIETNGSDPGTSPNSDAAGHGEDASFAEKAKAILASRAECESIVQQLYNLGSFRTLLNDLFPNLTTNNLERIRVNPHLSPAQRLQLSWVYMHYVFLTSTNTEAQVSIIEEFLKDTFNLLTETLPTITQTIQFSYPLDLSVSSLQQFLFLMHELTPFFPTLIPPLRSLNAIAIEASQNEFVVNAKIATLQANAILDLLEVIILQKIITGPSITTTLNVLSVRPILNQLIQLWYQLVVLNYHQRPLNRDMLNFMLLYFPYIEPNVSTIPEEALRSDPENSPQASNANTSGSIVSDPNLTPEQKRIKVWLFLAYNIATHNYGNIVSEVAYDLPEYGSTDPIVNQVINNAVISLFILLMDLQELVKSAKIALIREFYHHSDNNLNNPIFRDLVLLLDIFSHFMPEIAPLVTEFREAESTMNLKRIQILIDILGRIIEHPVITPIWKEIDVIEQPIIIRQSTPSFPARSFPKPLLQNTLDSLVKFLVQQGDNSATLDSLAKELCTHVLNTILLFTDPLTKSKPISFSHESLQKLLQYLHQFVPLCRPDVKLDTLIQELKCPNSDYLKKLSLLFDIINAIKWSYQNENISKTDMVNSVIRNLDKLLEEILERKTELERSLLLQTPPQTPRNRGVLDAIRVAISNALPLSPRGSRNAPPEGSPQESSERTSRDRSLSSNAPITLPNPGTPRPAPSAANPSMSEKILAARREMDATQGSSTEIHHTEDSHLSLTDSNQSSSSGAILRTPPPTQNQISEPPSTGSSKLVPKLDLTRVRALAENCEAAATNISQTTTSQSARLSDSNGGATNQPELPPLSARTYADLSTFDPSSTTSGLTLLHSPRKRSSSALSPRPSTDSSINQPPASTSAPTSPLPPITPRSGSAIRERSSLLQQTTILPLRSPRYTPSSAVLYSSLNRNGIPPSPRSQFGNTGTSNLGSTIVTVDASPRQRNITELTTTPTTTSNVPSPRLNDTVSPHTSSDPFQTNYHSLSQQRSGSMIRNTKSNP
jgi:hypothetical protein